MGFKKASAGFRIGGGGRKVIDIVMEHLDSFRG